MHAVEWHAVRGGQRTGELTTLKLGGPAQGRGADHSPPPLQALHGPRDLHARPQARPLRRLLRPRHHGLPGGAWGAGGREAPQTRHHGFHPHRLSPPPIIQRGAAPRRRAALLVRGRVSEGSRAPRCAHAAARLGAAAAAGRGWGRPPLAYGAPPHGQGAGAAVEGGGRRRPHALPLPVPLRCAGAKGAHRRVQICAGEALGARGVSSGMQQEENGLVMAVARI